MPKTHAQHLRLARRQTSQYIAHGLHEADVRRRLDRRHDRCILDEIAEVRILVVADRRLHRDRFLRDLEHLRILSSGISILIASSSGVGSRPISCSIWREMRFNLLIVSIMWTGMRIRARLIGDRARDRLADPPGRVRRELVAAAVFELVDRLHEADVAFLDQIEELQAAVRVLLRDRDHETQVRLDHLLLRAARFRFTDRHRAIDFLDVADREE